MFKILLTSVILTITTLGFCQSTPTLIASDLISSDIAFSPISQSCDIYLQSSDNDSQKKKFIHTPFFAFETNKDNKIIVRKNKLSNNKTQVIISLLCSPVNLKEALAEHLRMNALKYSKDFQNISTDDLITPNFKSLSITDVTGDATFTFSKNNTVVNSRPPKIDLVMIVDDNKADEIITELQTNTREFRFQITYEVDAKFIVSSSDVTGTVANVRKTDAFQELKGSASAFKWAADYGQGSVTKDATVLTRNQKQSFYGRLENELQIKYDIDVNSPDDITILQTELDKYFKDILSPVNINLQSGEFSKEIARLSSYGFSPKDIEPDEVNKFVSDIKNFLQDESKTVLDIDVTAKGGGFFGLISADLNTKYKKDEFVKKLRDNGWKIDFDGKTYIPKSMEIYVVNNQFLEQKGFIQIKINKTSTGKLKPQFEISTKNNALYNDRSMADVFNFYDKFMLNSCPIGTILSYAGDTSNLQKGWILCNGKEITINGNEQLFKSIGYSWGKGQNTNFNLPDLRGYFLRGVSYDSGRDPDIDKRSQNGNGEKNKVGSYQSDEFTSHHHDWTASIQCLYDDGNCSTELSKGDGGSVGTFSKSTDTRGGNETRPKNAYVNYIIRVN